MNNDKRWGEGGGGVAGGALLSSPSWVDANAFLSKQDTKLREKNGNCIFRQ